MFLYIYILRLLPCFLDVPLKVLFHLLMYLLYNHKLFKNFKDEHFSF